MQCFVKTLIRVGRGRCHSQAPSPCSVGDNDYPLVGNFMTVRTCNLVSALYVVFIR